MKFRRFYGKYLMSVFIAYFIHILLPKPIDQRLGVDSQTLKTGFFYFFSLKIN